jgi:hypothetical protein
MMSETFYVGLYSALMAFVLAIIKKKGRTEEGRKKVFISNYWAKSAKSFL